MMRAVSILLTLSLLKWATLALKYDPKFEDYNLNTNKAAVEVLDYSGKWENHDFQPSPKNWRFPFYTLFIDRWVNGDPKNDNINGTQFEQDPWQTQLRHGGDVQGLIDSLDYLQGMGIRGIYIAGTPFINLPWEANSFSPTDFSLLDLHYGTIKKWREAIDDIHRRGMYVVFDNVMSTMSDLIMSNGFENATTPFDTNEHKVAWRDPNRRYLDFDIGNKYNKTCEYPRFWFEDGFPVGKNVTDQLVGCYDSDFDQYGDIEGFGVHPDWQRQLAKFSSVQDRLREWVPNVRKRIEKFSCLAIQMLDIDGYRLDKATQITVDALAEFSKAMRKCAEEVGKDNFFNAGEITGGNTFASIYLGRGRQPDMKIQELADSVTTTNKNRSSVIRDEGLQALDSGAFHFTTYRTLTRFLGMDGELAAGFDSPTDWVDQWNDMLLTNDLVSSTTGKFDPRHMHGTTNQDVFRWPGIKDGKQRMLLGMFITTLQQPGMPVLLYGEEQAFYVFDSTAPNYIFGRQSMSASIAWKIHSCYKLGSEQYKNWPLESALHGCEDDWNVLDHRDPAAPIRNILKSMYQMRENFPTLNDGYFLQKMSNQTQFVQLPGSNTTQTEFGMWSIMRGIFAPTQDLSDQENGNQSVWLLYQNRAVPMNYEFDCSDNDTALISPFDAGDTVKNLFYPFDELELGKGPKKLGLYGSEKFNGCLKQLNMRPWDFRAYVPKDKWIAPSPMMTRFVPGHDARIESKGGSQDVPIEIHYSEAMDCDKLLSNMKIVSQTETSRRARIDQGSVKCGPITDNDTPKLIGAFPSKWAFKATVRDAAEGIHEITLDDIPAKEGNRSMGGIDHLLFRIGKKDNPVVFPENASYTEGLLKKRDDGSLLITHKAAGADLFRYSTNWGSNYSDWLTYNGGTTKITRQPWSGTEKQKWKGDHVIVQYFSKLTGSSSYVQHADVDFETPRRFPHLFMHGAYNMFGFDGALKSSVDLKTVDNKPHWQFNLVSEWPTLVQFNVWGINPDGEPDQTGLLGDADFDNVLDRLSPVALTPLFINVSTPETPHLFWRLSLDDSNLNYTIDPIGHSVVQLIIFIIMWVVPITTAILAVYLYTASFYKVKFNMIGIPLASSILPAFLMRRFGRGAYSKIDDAEEHPLRSSKNMGVSALAQAPLASAATAAPTVGAVVPPSGPRKTVLIATMEYDIEDWAIKIKIGGLGVMAQLMGKNLEHQNLIWVVPCVGGIDYPDEPGALIEPMEVTILGKPYLVTVRVHLLRNITYVLLDAPVFRSQSKADPYPPRMDDLESAIYYSTWNQCIALTVKRFPTIDLYHINDYHGALAPLYLLPDTIPCALSLHNAEFQGLWPMRNEKEKDEVCNVFNLDPEVVEKYVQFGQVFNLLHAGASYLRVHQKGFGAVGVSKKYGKRSWARYPIFWGLKDIGNLPNPDPSDTAPWSREEAEAAASGPVVIDEEFERKRGELKRQAQEWAGLAQNPNAELLVFVGRWSTQKGVDLIADIMPAVLHDNENVQLICVGPVIDLYGKFAAMKLKAIMEQYPDRVYSKPEFTALPPYIFSGAEFALIPSRDEPFGLVAVEFGRKGALGIGARVGGLGQMPGWWFTVESTTTSHMLQQFKEAVREALASDVETRRNMRARSAKQRFPVAQWVEDLESLQSTVVKIHQREASKGTRRRSRSPRGSRSSLSQFMSSDWRLSQYDSTAYDRQSLMVRGRPESSDSWAARMESPPLRPGSRAVSPSGQGEGSRSLGMRLGPGQFGGDSDNERDERRLSGHPDEYVMAADEYQAYQNLQYPRQRSQTGSSTLRPDSLMAPNLTGPPSFELPRAFDSTPTLNPDYSLPGTPQAEDQQTLLNPSIYQIPQASQSNLSVTEVVGNRKGFSLQNVDPTFLDTDEHYLKEFEQQLRDLDVGNSEKALSIEPFLKESEKDWFKHYREAKLKDARHSRRTSEVSLMQQKEFETLLGDNYHRPTVLKRLLLRRLGDWPIYSFLLALGQILAASSYQVTLLSGTIKQDDARFYTINAIYLSTSIFWWIFFRMFKSFYILSGAFCIYGTAFLLLGLAPQFSGDDTKLWFLNVASGLYAFASSSGALFFALNFGDEGGSPIKTWVFRCCVIQGTQQIYICALWYWGDYLQRLTTKGQEFNPNSVMTYILAPLAALLYLIGILLFVALPDYYRQMPGKIPSFYSSLYRRNIVLWFFAATVLQNAFLGIYYGRNWQFLWSSQVAKTWQIVLLAIFFFLVLWIIALYLFSRLANRHSWILPLFAIGLGAPRWAQMLWSCSGLGFYLPWVGSELASALLSRSLWLWLGLLDALQGVGFGIILLQTLTRVHICATLLAAQVLGTAVLMIAKGIEISTGQTVDDIFPTFGISWTEGLDRPFFWIGLACQLGVCVGFAVFFRKEQLTKP